MSPRATCCLTMSYSAAVSRPGLRRIGSGMPILPMSWSSPASWIERDDVRVEAEPLGQEDRVAGDVLGVPLRIAVLRVDGDDEALEDVEAGRRRPPRPRSPATRIASPPLALRVLEGPGRGRQEGRDRRRRGPGSVQRPALIVTGSRSVVSNWRLRSTSAPRRRSRQARARRPRRTARRAGTRPGHSDRRRWRPGRGVRSRSATAISAASPAGVAVVVVEQPEVVDVDQGDAERQARWRVPARSRRPGGRPAPRG